MVKFINYHQKFSYLDVSTSTGRMKTSFLHLVPGTVSNRCAKKTVVRMTESVAALLTVHGSSFIVDVDRLLYPSGGSVWFPVDH